MKDWIFSIFISKMIGKIYSLSPNPKLGLGKKQGFKGTV